jgi:hypothetical protein
MSVRGEFARTLAETAACLCESDESAARGLAARLEQTRELARNDLEAAARALLADWQATSLALPAPAQARLAEASERMLAIARVILGR